jgi:ATP-dependent helicase HrpA
VASRNFAELQIDREPEQQKDLLAGVRKKWERDNISTWDFDRLPDKIPVQGRDQKLLGFAYPALQPDKDGTVSIRLYADPEESRHISRLGVLALYRLQFSKQFRLLKKECVLPSSLWALYEGLGSRTALNEALYHFVLQEIFIEKEKNWPSKEAFSGLIEKFRKEGLFARARQLTESILRLLKERREILDRITAIKSKSPAKGRPTIDVELFRAELAATVPLAFLEQFDSNAVSSAIRYCRALQIRIERAYVSPGKDKAKAAQLAPHAEKLEKITVTNPSPACLELLQEYRTMLAEYKVSLFAQEMKTEIPVSARRLEKKWQDILYNCCM